MTKCEELQFDLPLYTDGSLDANVRSAIDAHLPECPLCRQKLSEFQDLTAGLKAVPRFTAPDRLIESVRAAVSAHLSSAISSPTFRLIDTPRRWTEVWLMPSSVGTMATLLFGFTLLSLVLNSEPIQLDAYSPSRSQSTPVLRTNNMDLSPDEYAYTRLSIADESPSINPRGALVALTKSLVRGEMRDDEVVVVADVFGNGLAQIAEVVEPSHDRRAIEELRRALESDPSFAPFVPANMDRRSESVRVVLKIQNVNVRTGTDGP